MCRRSGKPGTVWSSSGEVFWKRASLSRVQATQKPCVAGGSRRRLGKVRRTLLVAGEGVGPAQEANAGSRGCKRGRQCRRGFLECSQVVTGVEWPGACTGGRRRLEELRLKLATVEGPLERVDANNGRPTQAGKEMDEPTPVEGARVAATAYARSCCRRGRMQVRPTVAEMAWGVTGACSGVLLDVYSVCMCVGAYL